MRFAIASAPRKECPHGKPASYPAIMKNRSILAYIMGNLAYIITEQAGKSLASFSWGE
jgi:hypothetical protein